MRNFIPKPKMPRFQVVNFLTALKDLTLLPFRNKVMRKLGTIVLWTPKKILWVLRQVCYGIAAAPGMVFRSPVKLYHKTKKWRDWVLEKIDYLEAESAKWKRTFQIIKSPYSLLLKMGF